MNQTSINRWLSFSFILIALLTLSVASLSADTKHYLVVDSESLEILTPDPNYFSSQAPKLTIQTLDDITAFQQIDPSTQKTLTSFLKERCRKSPTSDNLFLWFPDEADEGKFFRLWTWPIKYNKRSAIRMVIQKEDGINSTPSAVKFDYRQYMTSIDPKQVLEECEDIPQIYGKNRAVFMHDRLGRLISRPPAHVDENDEVFVYLNLNIPPAQNIPKAYYAVAITHPDNPEGFKIFRAQGDVPTLTKEGLQANADKVITSAPPDDGVMVFPLGRFSAGDSDSSNFVRYEIRSYSIPTKETVDDKAATKDEDKDKDDSDTSRKTSGTGSATDLEHETSQTDETSQVGGSASKSRPMPSEDSGDKNPEPADSKPAGTGTVPPQFHISSDGTLNINYNELSQNQAEKKAEETPKAPDADAGKAGAKKADDFDKIAVVAFPVNELFNFAFRVGPIATTVRDRSYQKSLVQVSGDTRREIVVDTSSDKGGRSPVGYAFFTTLYINGRDLRKDPENLLDRINPTFGVGLNDPTKNLFVGVNVEVARGIELSLGRHFSKVNRLREGLAVGGDVPPGLYPDGLTNERWVGGGYYGITVDSSAVGKFFNLVFGPIFK